MNDPARLYQHLLNTGLQSKDNPLYQLLRELITAISQLNSSSVQPVTGTGGPNLSNKNFLTHTDESSSLPNSRDLLPGDAIGFDDLTPNERTVNVKVDGATIIVNIDNELESTGTGPGGLERQTDSFTTGIISSGGTALGSFTITGDWQSAELLKLQSDRACYIVLYATESARNNDTRILPAITDPLAGIGILMDAAFDVGGGEIDVSPPVILYNIENPVDYTFYYRLYNAEASSGATEIILTYVGFE